MKYRFEIHYMNKLLKEIGEFMSKLDLCHNIYALKEIMTFTAQKQLSIKELKDLITEAYKSCDCEVINIEGGTVE